MLHKEYSATTLTDKGQFFNQAGSICSMLTCCSRDLILNPTRGKLVWTHVLSFSYSFAYMMYYKWCRVRGIPLATIFSYTVVVSPDMGVMFGFLRLQIIKYKTKILSIVVLALTVNSDRPCILHRNWNQVGICSKTSQVLFMVPNLRHKLNSHNWSVFFGIVLKIKPKIM